MFEKEFRNQIKCLNGTQLVSTYPVNMKSVAFYEIFEMKEHSEMFWMLPQPLEVSNVKKRMLKLRTVYILNDWLRNEYNKDYTHKLVGNKFPPLPRNTT